MLATTAFSLHQRRFLPRHLTSGPTAHSTHIPATNWRQLETSSLLRKPSHSSQHLHLSRCVKRLPPVGWVWFLCQMKLHRPNCPQVPPDLLPHTPTDLSTTSGTSQNQRCPHSVDLYITELRHGQWDLSYESVFFLLYLPSSFSAI